MTNKWASPPRIEPDLMPPQKKPKKVGKKGSALTLDQLPKVSSGWDPVLISDETIEEIRSIIEREVQSVGHQAVEFLQTYFGERDGLNYIYFTHKGEGPLRLQTTLLTEWAEDEDDIVWSISFSDFIVQEIERVSDWKHEPPEEKKKTLQFWKKSLEEALHEIDVTLKQDYGA